MKLIIVPGVPDRGRRRSRRASTAHAHSSLTCAIEPLRTIIDMAKVRTRARGPRRPDGTPSKAQILERVWNYDFAGRSNVVELYVSYLRKKIDAGG
jgi:hypothetical protein